MKNFKRTVALILLIMVAAIAVAEYAVDDYTLYPGDKGDAVKTLQAALIDFGYLDGRASGTYNNKTEQAVADFQYYTGLNAEPGVATEDTQYLLSTMPIGTTYAVNTKTYKYHLPGCGVALRMSDESRLYVSSSASELADYGYAPCSVCNPDAMDWNGWTGNNAYEYYVINSSTGKFHMPRCSIVSKMKPENIAYSYENRDTLVYEGYVPCTKCNP